MQRHSAIHVRSGKPPIWLPVPTEASRTAIGAKVDRCGEDGGGRDQARKNFEQWCQMHSPEFASNGAEPCL